MSWLDDSFTESDAINKKVETLKRKTTDRWYDSFPQDDEGSEGESRYVYSNGIPALCIKMNNEWHFLPLQTIGKRGALRSGDGGLTADMLEDYMPLEPAYDSNWRQLFPVADISGISPGDFYTDTTNNGQWGTNTMMGSGLIWECVANGPNGSAFFLCRHNLGLTRPPKNIQVYICDSAPSTGDTLDISGDPTVNCLSPGGAYANLDDAITDGLRVFGMQYEQNFWIDQYWEGIYYGGTEGVFDGKTRTIIDAGKGHEMKQGMDSVGTNGYAWVVQSYIISPNEIMFYCEWPTMRLHTSDAYETDYDAETEYCGFQNMEWLRMYIWR